MRRTAAATWTRGMPKITKSGKLFFDYFFVIGDCPREPSVPNANWRHSSRARDLMMLAYRLVVWKIIGRHFGRRTKHVIASSRRASVTPWHEFVVARIRRDRSSATRRQTQNES